MKLNLPALILPGCVTVVDYDARRRERRQIAKALRELAEEEAEWAQGYYEQGRSDMASDLADQLDPKEEKP